jgi:hypothetical protein
MSSFKREDVKENFDEDTGEAMWGKQRMTQASLIYLRNDGAKYCMTELLQDFLRLEGIAYKVDEI